MYCVKTYCKVNYIFDKCNCFNVNVCVCMQNCDNYQCAAVNLFSKVFFCAENTMTVAFFFYLYKLYCVNSAINNRVAVSMCCYIAIYGNCICADALFCSAKYVTYKLGKPKKE